jgi:ABC-type branched-subunit amino acid transport system ATPase component
MNRIDFPVSFANSKISFLNNQHLEVDEIPDGITFIKSPKGSGKTTSLTNILEKLLRKKFRSIEDFEEESFNNPDLSLDTQYRVLLIGHRVALIKDLCNRLGLNCYLDDNSDSSSSRKQ